MNPYPDPEFQVNPDPIRIQGFDDQKRKKKNKAKIFFKNLFLIKNCNLLMFKPEENLLTSFALMDPGPIRIRIRIRIHNTCTPKSTPIKYYIFQKLLKTYPYLNNS